MSALLWAGLLRERQRERTHALLGFAQSVGLLPQLKAPFPSASSMIPALTQKNWLVSALLWPMLESLMVVDEHRNNPALQ
nr:hypothetical protein [Nostoc sp. DedQUE07]MDZ8133217.1 hypothetical protein [Nostoc sp. DedQUE07]